MILLIKELLHKHPTPHHFISNDLRYKIRLYYYDAIIFVLPVPLTSWHKKQHSQAGHYQKKRVN
jgi:hypothetical protein